jgi:hypothetical protein
MSVFTHDASPVRPPAAAPPTPPPDAAVPAAGGPATLDQLAALDGAALGALYRGARTPQVPDLDGDLVGRMLAAPALPRWTAGPLRRFAAWTGFPWRGKSFDSRRESRGTGINRVFRGLWAQRWFPFETFVAPSRAGAFDAFQLDYDNPSNPWFIRAIKDEVREVAPGLFLGQAYFVWRGKPRLVLYFGLCRP